MKPLEPRQVFRPSAALNRAGQVCGALFARQGALVNMASQLREQATVYLSTAMAKFAEVGSIAGLQV